MAFVYSRAKPKHLDFRSEYRYRDYDDLASRNNCTFCTFILQNVDGHHNALTKEQYFQLQIFPAHEACYVGVSAGFGEWLEVTSEFGWVRRMCRLNEDYCRRLELLENGATFAVDTVKSWLIDCASNHHHDQDNIARNTSFAPRTARKATLLLIDVNEKKPVCADTSARYVALSYVWGRRGSTVDNFETTKATVHQLMVSFSEISGIPVVVRDAMQFVSAVGERYLWVDRLCIVQDDAANKHENISQMDKIYEGAVFTIIAASGISGDDPLPGVRLGTRAPQVSELAGGVRLRRISRGRNFALDDYVWNTRGWTFQEMHLSRRRVIFTTHEVFCECADSAVAELDLGEVGLDPSGDKTLLHLGHPEVTVETREEEELDSEGRVQRRYTAFGEAILAYWTLVREYTNRQFSFDSDILNAITGILSYLASRTGWGFMFGLPANELGLALLWLPEVGLTASRRTLTSETGIAAENLPSWSWIGWRSPMIWLHYVHHTTPTDKAWTFEDRVEEYKLADRNCLQDRRSLPRNGELYPKSLGISSVCSLLCFGAEVVPASRFTIPDFRQLGDAWPAKIMDSQGIYCGSLFPTTVQGLDMPETLKLSFVALSASEFHKVIGEQELHSELGPLMFTRNKSALGYGKTVNGLLVKEERNISERIAVFQIDSEAWEKQVAINNSVFRTVYLG